MASVAVGPKGSLPVRVSCVLLLPVSGLFVRYVLRVTLAVVRGNFRESAAQIQKKMTAEEVFILFVDI